MPARSVVIESLRSSPASATRSSPPASTRSSPAGPGGAASTPSATRSCCGRRSCTLRPGRGAGRRAVSSRSAPRSGRPTTWPPTSSAATTATRPIELLEPVVRPVPGRPLGRPLEAPAGRPRASCSTEAEAAAPRASAATSTSTAAAARPTSGAAREAASRLGGRGRRRARARSQPGDVIRVGGDRLAVLSVAHRKGGVRVRVVDAERRARSARRATTSTTRRSAGPASTCPSRSTRTTASSSSRWPCAAPQGPAEPPAPWPTAAGAEPRTAVADPRRSTRSPRCPDLDAPPVGGRASATGSGARSPTSTGASHGAHGSVARRFDSVLEPARAAGGSRRLGAHRAGRGPGPDLPRVRPAGGRGRSPTACSTISTRPALAGLVSCSPTSTEQGRARRRRGSRRRVRDAGDAHRAASARRLGRRARRRPGCPRPGCPTPRSSPLAYAWAAGESLRHGPDDEDLSGGDFVRNVKQLIDLLRQIGEVAPGPADRAPPPAGRRAPVPRHRRGLVGGRRRPIDGREPIGPDARPA